MANKQWTVADLDKIWNNTGNGAQAKSAPLPTLNDTSKKYNYTPKSYEKNKEYTTKDIDKIWRNVERGKQVQDEMKKKAESAPAKNRTVPTREETLQKKYDAVKDIDTRNVDRKQEADIKKIGKAYNAVERKYGKGNIDLTNRPQYKNEDGSVSTVRSMSFNENGKEILVPTIAYDNNGNAVRLSDEEAIKRYHDTGEYLGKFNSVKEANAYAEKLHNDQAEMLKKNTIDLDKAPTKFEQKTKGGSLPNKPSRFVEQEKKDLNLSEPIKFNPNEKNGEVKGEKRTLDTKPSTRYENRTAGQIKEQPQRDTTYDKDFEDFYEWRYNRADTTDYNAQTDTNEPHWLKVKEELKKKNNWSDEEFESRWKEYDKSRRQEMANEEVSKAVELGKEHPILASLVQGAYNPQTAIEGGVTGLQGLLSNTIFKQELPESSDDPQFTGTRTKEAMLQSVMDNNIDSALGKKAYGAATSIGDMLLNNAFGGGAPLGMGLVTGLQSAARNQMRALERGADPESAAQFATAAGITSGLMNSIGLDKAMGTAANTVKGAIAKGAATEGLENLVEDATTLTLDSFINKDKSQLNTLHDYYSSQGMSDNDAWTQVMKDTGLDLLTSTLSGAAFGGLVRGAKNLPELASEIKGDIGNIRDRMNAKSADIPRIGETPSPTAQAPEPISVGKTTTIQRPYTGAKPVQSEYGGTRIDVPVEYLDEARKNIQSSIEVGNAEGKSYKKPLTQIYKKLFDSRHTISFDVPVKNLTMDGEDYVVTVNKGAIAKIMSDKNISPEKVAVIEKLEDIIRDSEYLDSGEVDRTNGKKKNVQRYDYFETPINIGDKNYIVSFDVEVLPGTNKYRTHKVIDEINLSEVPGVSTDTSTLHAVSSQDSKDLFNSTVTPNGEIVNAPAIKSEKARNDADAQNYEQAESELPWITPSDSTPNESSPNNRLDMNLQYFAERKSKIESELSRPDLPEDTRAELTAELDRINELISGMDERYYGKESTPQEKLSKSITNSDSRIDSEYANELKENGIGKYFSETHEQSYTDARDEVSADREGNLNRYLNNEGAMYNAKDYNKIRILEEDLKAKRKIANEEGNTELAQQITDQLHRLSEVRILRGKSGGAFNEAAKMWINTAEGAIDTAKSVVYDAIDKMPKNEANFIREMTDEVMDYANEVASSEELWNELKQGEKRLKFEQDIQKKLKALAKEKNIKVNDELAKQIAKDIIDGANSDAISREIAAFHEYEFLGIDDEVLTEVEDMLDRAESMNFNSKERVKLENEAYRKLAREIYKNGGDFKDKWDAWRYFAMLSKVATDVRNVTSTGIFSGVMNRASNGIAGMVEGGVDNGIKIAKGMSNAVFKTDYDTSKGIKRTKSFFYNPLTESSKKMLSSAYKDANENSYRGLSGHKYNYHVGEGIENNKPVFRPNSIADKTLGKAFDVRSDVLGGEDFFFKHNKYATSLVGWLKANGLDESIFEDSKRFNELNNKKLLTKEESAELKRLRPREELLNEGREYAIKESKYSTYNSPNKAGKLATAARELRRSDNGGARMLGRWIEGMMAFKQVPVNILKTIYDYSPLSVGTTAKKTIQALASKDDTRVGKIGVGKAKINVGQSTVADAISQASKTLTGTGMAALGAFLYDNGMLIPAEDENTGKSDETKGFQKYSLIINGKSYKIDWLGTPAAPLIMGAEAKKVYDKYHNDDTPFWDKENGIFSMGVNDVVDSAMSVFDPVTEMSFLQGFSNTLDNVRYSDTKAEAAANLIASPIASYYAQAIPTPFGALGRTIDNTRRSLRTNTDGIGGIVERNVRQNLYNKLPFLESKNMPYVDMWGREQKNLDNDNILARAGYQFISPAYVKDINVEPYQAELDRLYNLDPEHYADVLNSNFPNKVDGERLSNEDYYKAQTKAGVSKQNFINETIKNDAYKALTPDEQYEVQKSLLKLANEIGAKEVRPQKKVNDDLYTAFNGKNYGQVVNLAAEMAHDTVRNSTIKEAGLPVNEVTKSLFDNNDKEGQQKYRDGLGVAANYGYDTLTTDEWKTYNKQGGVALSRLLENKKAAEEYGVTNTQEFREAKANGTAKSYANAYNAITNTKTGTDDLGDDTYLSYNDTTRKIYDDKGQVGLYQYVQFQNSLPKKDSLKDRDYLNTLQKSAVMNLEDKAYYFVLHKGKNVAKSAPSGNVNQYAWYLAKDYYSGSDGKLSKNEKAELYRGVHDYLKRMGFSETVAKSAQKWNYQ